MKRLLVALVGSLLAGVTLVGVSAEEPPAARATGGGEVSRCGGGKIYLGAKERKSFRLHNEVRRDRNLKPFCVHPDLQKAARSHSEDMIRRDYFSHNTKGKNEGACERVRRFGYRFRSCGENIAWGSGPKGSPGNIMRNWMNSSGHRANILNNKYREVGIGTHTGTFNGTRNVTMYTADFGARL